MDIAVCRDIADGSLLDTMVSALAVPMQAVKTGAREPSVYKCMRGRQTGRALP
jgi:hypothetical protein